MKPSSGNKTMSAKQYLTKGLEYFVNIIMNENKTLYISCYIKKMRFIININSIQKYRYVWLSTESE